MATLATLSTPAKVSAIFLSVIFLFPVHLAMIAVDRPVFAFSGVKASGPFFVVIDLVESEGNEGLRIESDADDWNTVNAIQTFVDPQSQMLIIDFPYSYTIGNGFSIIPNNGNNVMHINSMQVAGGSVTINGVPYWPPTNVAPAIRLPALIRVFVSARFVNRFEQGGPGYLIVKEPVTASSVQISNSGSGSTLLTVQQADTVQVQTKGSGDVYLAIRQATSSNLQVQGSGDIKVRGSTQNANVRIMGSGNVDCNALQAGNVQVSVMGSGDALVNAQGSLSITIMGSGHVSYRGNRNPSITKMGTGTVSRISES